MNRNNPDQPASTELEIIEIQTGLDPGTTIIWLHGLGADGHDFVPVADQLELPANAAFRFVFPHAPLRSITINNGMVMRGWYDIRNIPLEADETGRADRPGLEQSCGIVRDLIAQENRRGIAADHIFLAGFSQGGAVALFSGLRFPCALAGIIALSAYLPDPDSIEAERSARNRATPIFMGHGNQDPVIPVGAGRHSYRTLAEAGYNVNWHTYDMPHSVHPEEIRDIARFIRKHSGT